MAGGAGTASAARMFEVDIEIERYIQNRLGLAVIVVRKFAFFELYCFAFR